MVDYRTLGSLTTVFNPEKFYRLTRIALTGYVHANATANASDSLSEYESFSIIMTGAGKVETVLREEGFFVFLWKALTKGVAPKLIDSWPLRTILGGAGWALHRARTRRQYEKFRQRYDIDPSFEFAKPGTVFVGEGQISVGGEGHIGANSVVDAFEGTTVSIGDYAHLGSNVRIYTANYDSTADLYAPGYTIERNAGDIRIGDGVWIGDNAVLTPGTTIEDGVIVGANAVVTEDVPEYTVVGGVPARKIRDR